MLRAAYERIVVKPYSQEKKINGIIVNMKKPYDTGRVVSVGDNVGIEGLSVGDDVYIHVNSGIEIECLDEKYWSVHRQSILCYIKDE